MVFGRKKASSSNNNNTNISSGQSHTNNNTSATTVNNQTSTELEVAVDDGNHAAQPTATTTAPRTTSTTITTKNAAHTNDLNEVLVVADTKNDTLHLTRSAGTDLEGSEASTGTVFGRCSNSRNNNNEGNNENTYINNNTNTISINNNAPIALEEEEEEEDEMVTPQPEKADELENKRCNDVLSMSAPNAIPLSVKNTTLRPSKSRVRTYLRRFQERLTGHHQPHPVDALPSVSNASRLAVDIENQLAVNDKDADVNIDGNDNDVDDGDDDAQRFPPVQSQSTTIDLDCVSTAFSVIDEDNDNGSYEDIDFGLATPSSITTAATTTISTKQAKSDLLAEIDAHQAELRAQLQASAEEQTKAEQREFDLAALIDAYLSNIYPVYHEGAREILIREARDLLFSQYDGSLEGFERLFLMKFAEIAEDLRRKHTVGEFLTWCKGWPLATTAGEVILHLGALDETEVKPAEFYLCVKAVDGSDPQLYAVWRTSHQSDVSETTTTPATTTLHSRCIDYTDPKIYLSILNLEMMLSDELPQLLQNLLVGVERAIGRLSLNELTLSSVGGQQSVLDATNNNTNTNSNNNNNNNNNKAINIVNNLNKNVSNKTNAQTASLLASPKCGLKRSELITKNKMLNNKFMLRRLTNRQDSMTSTSSGNSSSSGGSTSSDELLSKGGTATLSSSSSVSPALPLFCLGNSFPHIDSDEENADEKRNSLDCDFSLSQEVAAPRSICEIPEKLLTSGIYLPGTRDLKGRSLITIDADCLLNAGLNCYEIATVLLYYSTIPESNADNNNGNSTQQQQQHQEQQQQQSPPASVPAIILSQKPAQRTFTILITIDMAHHLNAIDLICQSLKLLRRHVEFCEILAVCPDRSLLLLSKQRAAETTNWEYEKQQQQSQQQKPTTPSSSTSSSSPTRQQATNSIKFISVDEVTTSVAPSQLPSVKLRGLHHHDPRKWREFFALLEPFQSQCMATGQRLVTAMNEIRCADMQGLPTRRQLYAQHRALSRALMDSELHNVRKRGAQTLTRLQELAKNINSSAETALSSGSSSSSCSMSNNNNSYNGRNHSNHNNTTYSYSLSKRSTTASSASSTASTTLSSSSSVASTAAVITKQNLLNANNANGIGGFVGSNNNNSHSTSNNNNNNSHNNIDVAIRLNKVTLLFNEVDRAAKRLEQLCEQRRERLRELTRQRALEDEINEVTSWITSDGNETLQRFTNLQLDCETDFKDHEHDFEKYYFISMKHLAKGRDLHEAAADIDALHDSAAHLKTALDVFAEKLELARERIEGAARLHQLVSTNEHLDVEVRQEVQRLAEKIGLHHILEKYRLFTLDSNGNANGSGNENESKTKPNSLNLQFNLNLSCGKNASATNQTKPNTMRTSTPLTKTNSNNNSHCNSGNNKSNVSISASGIGTGSGSGTDSEGHACHCWRESRNVEDVDAMLDDVDDLVDKEVEEEEQSKIADSGLGGCERCEGNPKLSRICSCQSLNEAGNLYDKGHNSDELDDECFGRTSKRFLNIHSPMEANAHLQCYAFSQMEMPKMEELSCLEPKIQKTLLLIMREMIGTERDYVRSLYYVIENYIDELARDDIPQPLRGQRNVIFGNIEKIFEFHNSHFLCELERYELNPLKVGAAFLEMESKFYLYALYNKNKPKSDTLMSEYGTTFFKSKQLELNDKMDLASYLLKPVQRMGKYALLLQQLVKACSSVQGSALQEISADVEELQRAEEMVKFQLRHGNDLLAMDSLRDCDVNVKEQGRLMRQNEFLVWQGRGGKKTLRQIFLFEELVLFSKARRFPDHKNLDIYIYKNSIKTSDIGLTAHVGESPTKFEIWFRKRKPEDTWTLQCMSEDIKNAWTEEISKILWKQAKRNRDIRLAEMSSMGIGSKPCLDIRPSNNQINDRSITITQLGKAPKLRHSFINLQVENNKTSKRPNSLISESSISSGTSSSSTSTGSSSFSGSKHAITSSNNQTQHQQSHALHHHQHHGLELINESQALMLAAANADTTSSNKSNTLSSTSSGASGQQRSNHKRSTTLVSQLSMESGILSDISMTPEQEQIPDTGYNWSSTMPTSGVIMRKKQHYFAKNLEQLQPEKVEHKYGKLDVGVGHKGDAFIMEPTTNLNF